RVRRPDGWSGSGARCARAGWSDVGIHGYRPPTAYAHPSGATSRNRQGTFMDAASVAVLGSRDHRASGHHLGHAVLVRQQVEHEDGPSLVGHGGTRRTAHMMHTGSALDIDSTRTPPNGLDPSWRPR